MKTQRLQLLALCVVPLLAVSVPTLAQDCPPPGPFEPCSGCHAPGLNPNVQLAYEIWIESEHLNGVTFGADFLKDGHQSFRADQACGEPDRARGLRDAAAEDGVRRC